MQAHPEKWVAGHVSTLPKSGIRDFFEVSDDTLLFG